MAIGKLWAGRLYGTHTGNVFAKLEGEDAALTGSVHFNDEQTGVIVYNVTGDFDGTRLNLSGDPEGVERADLGTLTAAGSITDRGEIVGEWTTTVGSAGTFVFYPHDRAPTEQTDTQPARMHSARHDLSAIQIDRLELTSLADEIQAEFKRNPVIVTVTAGTTQARFLPDFKNVIFPDDHAKSAKIFVQEPEPSGINRAISIEFGPIENFIMAQSGDEAWAIGRAESLRRNLRRVEKTYATNIKRLGVGVNQLLLFWAIVFIPSLPTVLQRAVFLASIVGIALSVNFLHSRFLPHASILLKSKGETRRLNIGPTVLSWVIATTAGVAAVLVSAVIQKWLGMPAP